MTSGSRTRATELSPASIQRRPPTWSRRRSRTHREASRSHLRACTSPSARAGSSTAEEPSKSLTGVLDSVDPVLAYSFDSWAVVTMTNDGLVGFRKVGGAQGVQLVPDLATALPAPSDSGKTYTFQVRPGIRYSNGKTVQPGDFRRTFERVFELGSPGAPYYGGIVGADRCTKGKACDLSRGVVANRAARTVTIHLSAPDGDFLTKLAMPWAYAVPVSTPAKPASATSPVPATGPYRIAGYHEKTKTYRLVRNDRFREWSADAQPDGFPDVINVSERFGFLESDRIRAVRRGTGDIMLGGGPPISPDELEQLVARYPSRLRLNTAFATEYFFLNTRAKPFDDVRVRRAVGYAFDSEAYVDQANGVYAPTCQILPPNFPGYRPLCPYETAGVGRLGRARALVRAAGASGARVTVWVPGPSRRAVDTWPPYSSCSTCARVSVWSRSTRRRGPTTTSTRSATPALKRRSASEAGRRTIRPRPDSSRRSSVAPRSSRSLLRTRTSRSSATRRSTRRWSVPHRCRRRIPLRRHCSGKRSSENLLAHAPIVPTTTGATSTSRRARRQLPVQPAVGRPAQPALGEVDPARQAGVSRLRRQRASRR